jgi:hypothetical protein
MQSLGKAALKRSANGSRSGPKLKRHLNLEEVFNLALLAVDICSDPKGDQKRDTEEVLAEMVQITMKILAKPPDKGEAFDAIENTIRQKYPSDR